MLNCNGIEKCNKKLEFSYTIALMYSSTVISMLTRQSEPERLDSLQDLLKHQTVKIFINKCSFIDDMARSIPILKDLQHRIEYVAIDETDPDTIGEEMSKILSGSHVLIDDKDNLESRLQFLPQKMRCIFSIKKFHFSKVKQQALNVKAIRGHSGWIGYLVTQIYGCKRR